MLILKPITHKTDNMTQFEYSAKPPYPKAKDDTYFGRGVCYLIIEDTARRIDFRNDADLFFSLKYVPSGGSIGSIRTYMHTVYEFDSHIFNIVIESEKPFELIITSNIDSDLSSLTAKLITIKETEFTTKV